MTKEEFHQMFKTALEECEPQEDKWATWVLNITAGVPKELNDLVAPRLARLIRQLAQCLADRRVEDGNRLITQFDIEMRNLVFREREPGGILCPITARSEIARFVDTLREYAYNGHETEGHIRLGPDGVRIVKVGFDSVEWADGTVVTRANLREKLRPPSIFDAKWNQLFTSEAEVDAAREQKRLREMPQGPMAGPLDENLRPLQGGYSR
jgi:hypothetical protein